MASFSAQRYAGSFDFYPFDEDAGEEEEREPVKIKVRSTTKPLMDELNQAILVATDLEAQLEKAKEESDRKRFIELQPKRTEIVDRQILIFCPNMTQQWLDDTQFEVKTRMLEEIQKISGIKKMTDTASEAERQAEQDAALSDDAKKKSSADSMDTSEQLPGVSPGN